MAKLLIIADDFTGALDTGVMFAERGIFTLVETNWHSDFSHISAETEVLALTSETRHVPPEHAYEIVFDIVRRAREAGFTHIYKKTDSALRGNIGAELAAALDAFGTSTLSFIPALPTASRTTVEGIQYINGIPVSESVFGHDPYNPVRCSDVRQILAEQTGTPTFLQGRPIRPSEAGIHVYDVSDEKTLVDIANVLDGAPLTLTAGCAGFAAALATKLDFKRCAVASAVLDTPPFVLSGSINPITLAQLNEAEVQGFTRIRLTAEQKLTPNWHESDDFRKKLTCWGEQISAGGRFILESGDYTDGPSTAELARTLGLETNEIRDRIACALAHVTRTLIDMDAVTDLLCIGGDTLAALMDHLEISSLTPLCQIFPGTVISRFDYRGHYHNIISKSGGFGHPALIADLVHHTALSYQSANV